jgi:hypothetical protein
MRSQNAFDWRTKAPSALVSRLNWVALGADMLMALASSPEV